MKKLLALLLIIATLLLSSCSGGKYKEQKSTDEEATIVMTMEIDGNEYGVRYELYRALFLNYKSTVDGGDDSVWSGENKAQYVEKIDSMILDRVTEIYAAFAICKRIGFDVYSKSVEKKIQQNIKTSVEGGSYGNTTIQGYDSYEDYLAALKAANLNYSVQALLFRYAIAVDAIDSYYIGTASSVDIDLNMSVGAITYNKDDVKAFYDNDDECVQLLRTNYQKAISYTPKDKAEALRAKIVAAAASADDLQEKENLVAIAITSSSGNYASADEVKNGYLIGKYNLDRSYYGDMTDAAFSLELGEVSECIDIVTDIENAYYILYRTEKSDTYFEENYDSIKYIFLMNYVGKISHGVADELRSSVMYTDFLININHSEIGM